MLACGLRETQRLPFSSGAGRPVSSGTRGMRSPNDRAASVSSVPSLCEASIRSTVRLVTPLLAASARCDTPALSRSRRRFVASVALTSRAFSAVSAHPLAFIPLWAGRALPATPGRSRLSSREDHRRAKSECVLLTRHGVLNSRIESRPPHPSPWARGAPSVSCGSSVHDWPTDDAWEVRGQTLPSPTSGSLPAAPVAYP
jgi:hypothetical protein